MKYNNQNPELVNVGNRFFKLSALLLIILVSLFKVSANAYSQNSNLSISMKNADIIDVIKELEQQSSYDFFYKNKDLEMDKKINIDERNKTIVEILEVILQDTGLSYSIVNNDIVIAKRTKQTGSGDQLIQDNSWDVITGIVRGISGETLPGVTVLEKGTTNGVTTGVNGEYSIKIQNEDAILVFSYVGMKSREVRPGSQKAIDIVLMEDIIGLEEIVVIGYGTMVKKNLTGSVVVIDKELMGSHAPVNLSSALQGVATGVNVINNGLPGEEPVIQIRGVGSLSNNNPLYVIDGIPTGDSRELNPNDIESIQILKDASAAAIYGSRAANGVILITTKKGKEGVFDVDFSARYGIQQITNKLNLMNARGYADLNNLAHDNAGLPRNPGSDWAFDESVNTDWQDAFFKTGYSEDYNLSISNGTKNSSYMFSAGFFKNEGTVIGPMFKRTTISINAEHKFEKFKFGEHLKLSRSFDQQLIDVPFIDLVRMLPTIPVYDDSNPGGFGYGSDYNPTYGSNPVGLQELNRKNLLTNKILGNVYAEYQIIPSLKYRINIGLDFYNNNQKELHMEGQVRYNNPLMPSSLSENRREFFRTIMEHTLTYDKSLRGHNFNVLAGYAYEKGNFNNTYAAAENLATNPVSGDYYEVLEVAQDMYRILGIIEESVLLSQFGRLNYNFSNKYLFTATVRRDGSSNFREGNRWGVFPSFSAGWKIHEEDFFKEYQKISTLKLRGGFGQLGVQEAPPYNYMGLINSNANYVLGITQDVLNGHTQIKLANADLRWQTNTTTNIGLDVGLLQDKLFFATEYYISDISNALIPVDIPLSTGNFEGNPWANVGKFRNSGFEFALSFKDQHRDFKYRVMGTFSTLKNEVISLKNNPYGIVSWLTKTEKGYPVATLYLLETDGIFQSDQEVLDYVNDEGNPIQPDARAGFVKYVDHNSDGVINDDDRQMMGNPYPKYEFGLNLSAQYKGFDFMALFYGVGGSQVFNVPRFWLERTDDDSNYPDGFNTWTEADKTPKNPIALYGPQGARNNIQHSDRWIEDADFLKLKTLEIGYTLPEELLNRIGISSLRCYFNAQNLLTLTKYTGLDPEIINKGFLMRPVDDGSFPNVRTVSLGLQVRF